MLGEDIHENTHILPPCSGGKRDEITADMFKDVTRVHRLQVSSGFGIGFRDPVALDALPYMLLAIGVNTRPSDMAVKRFHHPLVAWMPSECATMSVGQDFWDELWGYDGL